MFLLILIGIGSELLDYRNNIIFFDYIILEWKFKMDDNFGCWYVMLNFNWFLDGVFLDCIYVFYKMDFKIVLKIVFKEKIYLFFGDLMSWVLNNFEKMKYKFELKSNLYFENFFWLKVIEGVYKEGLIEKIDYVEFLEDMFYFKEDEIKLKENWKFYYKEKKYYFIFLLILVLNIIIK